MSSLLQMIKSVAKKDPVFADAEEASSQEDEQQQTASTDESSQEETASVTDESSHEDEIEESTSQDLPDDESEEDDSEEDHTEDDSEDEQELEDETDQEDEDSDKRNRRRKDRQSQKVLKEIAQRKEAEKKADRLQARVNELEARLPDTETGLNFSTQEEIDARHLELRQFIRNLDDAIADDGFVGKDEKTGEDIEIDTKSLRQMKRAAEDERDYTLPKAEKRILERKRIEQDVVAKAYPDLLDDDSELSAEATKLFNEIPGLKSHPQALVLAGDLLRGRKARTTKKTASKAKPKPKVSKPPKEPGRGANTGSSVGTTTQTNDQLLMQKVAQKVIGQNPHY